MDSEKYLELTTEEYEDIDLTVEEYADNSGSCCPDCERPNQFGELCNSCSQEIEAYDRESLIDSEEFVPEIATPQELKVEVIQEEIE